MSSEVYDKMGGALAVKIAVDLFHDKVMRNKQIAHIFYNIDPSIHKSVQTDFITYALGGPCKEDHDAIKESYKRFVTDSHNEEEVNVLSSLLIETFEELNVSTEAINQLISIITEVRSDYLRGQK